MPIVGPYSRPTVLDTLGAGLEIDLTKPLVTLCMLEERATGLRE